MDNGSPWWMYALTLVSSRSTVPGETAPMPGSVRYLESRGRHAEAEDLWRAAGGRAGTPECT